MVSILMCLYSIKATKLKLQDVYINVYVEANGGFSLKMDSWFKETYNVVSWETTYKPLTPRCATLGSVKDPEAEND